MSISMAEDSIIINEINYNSADSLFPKDWVELYNVTTEPINIGNWIFRDDNNEHQFLIPINQILPPDGYIVICDSLNAFTILFPDVEIVIGDFDFKLNNDGELIRLFDDEGTLIDSVHYNDVEPWPIEADGSGATLELINPHYDNELASNWLASSVFGTPGQQNSNYIVVTQDCLGVWGGETEYDECGVCNGNNTTCLDCADVLNGYAELDVCGVCDTDAFNNCVQDCNSVWGGSAEFDDCIEPVCSGGTTNLMANASCTDCNGFINGEAFIDGCGSCVGGNTELEACPTDCAGVDGGDAQWNSCGSCICNTSQAEFGYTCIDEEECVQGCDFEWYNDGDAPEADGCGVCGGNNEPNTGNCDCAGVPDGGSVEDMCDICDGDSGNDCISDCSTSDSDCDGIWDNVSCWGGTAISDECGICAGGSTGVIPCVLANSNNILPLDFKIEGIYPNPFNPVTTIGYTVPVLTKVILEIYSINGIKISILEDNYISSGYHRVNWDASDHASGIYFVMMVADDYIATQKLMLVK